MRLVDAHCHLEDEAFDADREEVIRRALEAGVVAMLTSSLDYEGALKALGITRSHEGVVFLCVGLDPTCRDEGEVAAVEFARMLVATHPDAHILRALPVLLSIGLESEEYYCVDQTKFMMKTKKTFHSIKPLLERVFRPEWFKFTSGIPPKLCVRKDILEAIRTIFEA